MRVGYKVINDIFEGSSFFLLLNWQADNEICLVSFFGERYEELRKKDCTVGVWKVKKLKL